MVPDWIFDEGKYRQLSAFVQETPGLPSDLNSKSVFEVSIPGDAHASCLFTKLEALA